MSNEHMGFHNAVIIDCNGEQVAVDMGIVDLVMWANSFPGVSTFTSCQGNGCHSEAVIGFKARDQNAAFQVEVFIGRGRIEPVGDGRYFIWLSCAQLHELNAERFPFSDFWKHEFCRDAGVVQRLKAAGVVFSVATEQPWINQKRIGE